LHTHTNIYTCKKCQEDVYYLSEAIYLFEGISAEGFMTPDDIDKERLQENIKSLVDFQLITSR